MAQSILSRFNLHISKQRIQDVQEDLSEKRQKLEQQSTKVTGRLRDASLTTIYGLGATTLSRAAELSDKVPVVRSGATGLRQKAENLQQAGDAVQRPPIADYDELNVKQVAEALEGLSVYDLEKVKRYEKANKDRVTVMREVDRLVN